jgi:hypothetical protein
MADPPLPRYWAGPICLFMSIERWRCDVFLIAWIVRGSHDCRDAVKERMDVVRVSYRLRVESSRRELARPVSFESDYLMATALTSLNVQWPSRVF